MNRQTFSLSCRGSWLSVSWLMLFLALPGLASAVGLVGRDWTKRNPLPTGDSIFAVSAGAPTTNPPVGGTRLVAVGGHGLILTSDDGTSWTERTSGITTDLLDVVYIAGQLKYVAVGVSSRVLTSPDGITWTAATTTGSDNLNSVVYNGTQIVAVGGTGATGVTHTSATGATWTRSTTAVSAGEFRQVVVVGTFLYAVSSGVKGAILKGTFVANNWSWSKLAATSGVTAADTPLSLVYTGSRFVLSTQNGSALNLWQSTIGNAWTASTLGTGSPALAVSKLRWTGSEVIGVGAGGEVWKSADGVTFTAPNRIPTGQPQFLFSGAKIGSTYVVTGEGGRIFSITPPGESAWTSRYSSGVTVNIAGAATDGTGFVAVGENFTLTSPDGVAWTTQPQVSKSMRSAAHTGTGYVAVGSGAWTSADGITWTETLAPATAGTLIGSSGRALNSLLWASMIRGRSRRFMCPTLVPPGPSAPSPQAA